MGRYGTREALEPFAGERQVGERPPGLDVVTQHGIHSGFCGQAPSDFPEMAEFLVELGIHSMSLNPDTILATTIQVLKVEERLGRKPAPA